MFLGGQRRHVCKCAEHDRTLQTSGPETPPSYENAQVPVSKLLERLHIPHAALARLHIQL